jgi:hypothetical protein
MRSKILQVCILLISSVPLFAQSDSIYSPKIKYFNNLQAGGLFGDSGKGNSLSVSMTHGIRYERWSFGIIAGYDSYQDWRFVPVSADVSFDFARVGNNVFYVQGSAGYAIAAWVPTELDAENEYDSDGGLTFHPVVGYRIKANQYSLYLSAGYKFQRNDYTYTANNWIWGYPASRTSVRENMERLSIQIGLGLH